MTTANNKQLKKALHALRTQSAKLSDERVAHLKGRVFAATAPPQLKQQEESMPVGLYILMRRMGKYFVPTNMWRYALQPVMVVMIAFGVAAGGWVTSVQASSQSVPGDVLYSVKLASERTQLAFAGLHGDSIMMTDLRATFAKRRLQEVVRLEGDGTEKKSARVARAMKGFTKEINSIQKNMVSSDGTDASVAISAFDKSVELGEALEQVEDQLQALPFSGLSEAQKAIQETSDTAVALIVEKHDQGDESVTEQQVAQVVGDQLEDAHGEAVEQSIKEAENTAKAAQRFIEEKDFFEALARVRELQALSTDSQEDQVVVDITPELPIEDTHQAIKLPDVLLKVFKNVTSTIIGE